MQLRASRLVNVNIHSIRQRERRGEEEGEGKHRKNKGRGKYSKAHAWFLTNCKWKRKSPHQHIAIKGSSQDTCKLFSKCFSLCPLPCFSFPTLPLFHLSVCLLISYSVLFYHTLLHPSVLFLVFVFLFQWLGQHL